jgi:hypothetical protein
VEPEMLSDEAVIVVVPATDEVTNPLEPAVLLIVATPVSEELHVTEVVKSCVVPFEYVPVAMSCLVVPGSMPGFAGAIVIEESVTGEVPDPPPLEPPPLQLAISKRIRTRKSSLFNFINTDSFRY